MAKKKVTPGSLTNAYRKREGDFAPNLVGNQFTNGDALFTLGNFNVTTNLQPKKDTYFNTGGYSNVYTLDTLNLTETQSKELVTNDVFITLNMNTTDLSKFAYFGSMVEYLRVNIEDIITKWKGSLYITDDEGGYSTVAKNTVLGYNYDVVTNQSTLIIPTLYVQNNFELITNDLGGLILDENDISNIKLSLNSYELYNEYGSFEILAYTGDTPGVNPYINIKVKGEAFPTLTATTYGTYRYHVKPKDNVVDRLFFDKLSQFGNVLLNRLTSPRYTATFESVIETQGGSLMSVTKTFSWPTTDGYNLDIDTVEYSQYFNDLYKMVSDYDRLKGNLINRRFIANSIIEFDTERRGEDDGQVSNGGKVNKLLNIYGRSFDEVKKYVDAIKSSNVVTYDKKDNVPDELIKDMAKNLGFDTIKAITGNNLLTYISKANEAVFSGHSRSMSQKEIDIELWRRLVVNAWWLFKSKGHRKVIEFLVKLFGLGECLVNIDETVFVAKNKLDVEDTFTKVKTLLSRGLPEGTEVEVDRSLYPIDEEGFPRVLPNTPDYYFQMSGFWYNNGTQRTIGNNPHFGPYDYGNKYFDKFTCFVDNFSAGTQVFTEEIIENVNLFPDYNKGDLEITFDEGKPLQDYGVSYANIMTNSNRVSTKMNVVSAGFTTDKSRTGRGSLKITFNNGNDYCNISCPQYRLDTETGLVTELDNDLMGLECCNYYGFNYTQTKISDVYLQNLDENSLISYQTYMDRMTTKYGEQVFNNNSNLCYWCKPAIPVCDFTVYLNTVLGDKGVNGITDILLTEGVITTTQVNEFIIQWNKDPQNELDIIKNYFNTKYDGYCLIVDNDFKLVNKQCCSIRGGEWVNTSDEGTPPSYKCVIPKNITPELQPCVCELPEYCGDDHKLYIQIYHNGLNHLDCTDFNEVGGYTEEQLELLTTWRAERDLYLKTQIEASIMGLPLGSTVPHTPIPTPVPGFESMTGYNTWGVININNGCSSTYYPNGTDPEDIETERRQFRDAALKAKNELLLALVPYFKANEEHPYYFINKCGYGCTKTCECV